MMKIARADPMARFVNAGFRNLALVTIMVQLFVGCSPGNDIPTTGVQPSPSSPPTRKPVTALPDVTVLSKDERPNFVIIMADDLDLHLGTIDYMPHLKELLIDQGTVVENYYVNNPLCCPSRSTLLRGQYIHTHQVYSNTPPEGGYDKFIFLEHESSTLATWLTAAGYRTVLLGKYLNGYPLPNQYTHIPPGWSEWYSPAKGKPYVGFKYTLNENGQLVDYGDKPEDYLTDVLSHKAVDFIRRAAQNSVPFFVYLVPYAPHEPFTPAPRHADLFSDLQIPRTDAFNEEDVSDKPDRIRKNPLLTASQVANFDDKYRMRVRSMQAVDEMIAEVVLLLQEVGQLENTYLIFTSDNGYHMVQHRLKPGKGTAYREDIQVPLILRGPGIPAGATLRGYLAGNVDLAPTLAELAGVTTPSFVDGRSLVPLLFSLSGIETWRQVCLIEAYQTHSPDEESASPTSIPSWVENGTLEPPDLGDFDLGGAVIAYRSLRTAEYVYVEYADGFREYYDLLSDPYELDNLAEVIDPAWLQKLSAWLQSLSSCSGAQCRALEESPPTIEPANPL